jgi:hypothetical protein
MRMPDPLSFRLEEPCVVTADDLDVRPHRAEQCSACPAALGQPHEAECPIPQRLVRLELTLRLVVPQSRRDETARIEDTYETAEPQTITELVAQADSLSRLSLGPWLDPNEVFSVSVRALGAVPEIEAEVREALAEWSP